MSDNPETPGQQEPSGQQVGGNSGTTAPAGYVEQARYNGLVQKVQELTLANRSLNEQLTQKSSEVEQLKGQLSIKDVEKQAAVGERDTRLSQLLQDQASKEAELKDLRGLQLKLKVAKDLNRPELLKIADRIPALDDEEALKTVMQDLARFADDLVKDRERQLLAGVTPMVGSPASMAPAGPSTEQAWVEHINSLPLGSKERAKAMSDYGGWLENKYRQSP